MDWDSFNLLLSLKLDTGIFSMNLYLMGTFTATTQLSVCDTI